MSLLSTPVTGRELCQRAESLQTPRLVAGLQPLPQLPTGVHTAHLGRKGCGGATCPGKGTVTLYSLGNVLVHVGDLKGTKAFLIPGARLVGHRTHSQQTNSNQQCGQGSPGLKQHHLESLKKERRNTSVTLDKTHTENGWRKCKTRQTRKRQITWKSGEMRRLWVENPTAKVPALIRGSCMVSTLPTQSPARMPAHWRGYWGHRSQATKVFSFWAESLGGAHPAHRVASRCIEGGPRHRPTLIRRAGQQAASP